VPGSSGKQGQPTPHGIAYPRPLDGKDKDCGFTDIVGLTQSLGTEKQTEIITVEMIDRIPLVQLRLMLWPYIEERNGDIIIE